MVCVRHAVYEDQEKIVSIHSTKEEIDEAPGCLQVETWNS